MSWIDLVIAAVVVAATVRGLSVGALRQAGTTIGLLVGLIVGSILAPTLALHASGRLARAVIAVAIVAGFASLGAAAGREVVRLIAPAARRGALSTLDRVGGAVSAALGALIACWLVAGLLAGASALALSGAIASSRILTVVDALMPPLPSVESRVQALLNSTDFPAVFASVVAPSVPSATPASPSAARAAVAGTASSVVKVVAGACGADHEGTAFAVDSSLLVTAAHVVAGATTITVAGQRATVVLFDPARDVAILRTARSYPAIAIDTTVNAPGTPAAVVGFPLDQARRITPAAIAGRVDAVGRDIYDSSLVRRRLIVVSTKVQPGNSGSPVLVAGHAVGMIFSRSLSSPSTAYGVDAGTLRAELARAGSSAVSTGACLS